MKMLLTKIQPQQEQQQQIQQRYKTELCRSYQENGTCKYGDKCQFAHGEHELRIVSRHPKFKTELCRTFHASGYCPYGPRCHFIHDTHESRPNSASSPTLLINDLYEPIYLNTHSTLFNALSNSNSSLSNKSLLMFASNSNANSTSNSTTGSQTSPATSRSISPDIIQQVLNGFSFFTTTNNNFSSSSPTSSNASF